MIGTNTDDVRRRNLSAVLTLVHRSRALTRSALTRRTGLARSTVKDLVEELVSGGLVEETQAAPASQVGRPSPIVRPQTDTLAIAVNPESDAVTIGLIALGGTVLSVDRYPTDGIPSADDTVAITAKAVDRIRRKLDEKRRVTAIGVAVPGLVHAPDSVVRLAPNLDWHDVALGRMLCAAVELPVFAANDANLGAVAEHIFGGHRDAHHMIYVNGGASGIGAGFVVAGELLEGAAGYAGELGHTYVGGAAPCHCGRIGCLETEVSQTTAKTVAHQAQYLGIALGNAINLLNPNLVVLGGFLRAFPEQAAAALDTAVSRHSMRVPHEQVRIVAASLGTLTLMIGAAEAAFAPLLADPAAHYFSAAG
ncbi:sugar kinase [Mycobacterium sp. ACS1612]|uniref:ROK family transcriptional regulator n=1 Tax=Mycobacterium sp. ACS1612 TaxID=1834117 RepID=UPI0007FD6619|nr:ROK family transcriptional regulator [Mycobacterium sp. ACS1612]OBF31647.1 sugar kinase [Mycobacterium sp. ACS1612]